MATPTEKNIFKVYTFQFFWIFAIILPVLYPYYTSLGVNMHQFFQLQAVFGFAVAFFEIPTGYFSDHYGRKLSLVIGGFLAGVSYFVLAKATGFWGLVAHEFLLGLALSFVSGTDIAILFESIPVKSPRDMSSRILGYHQMAAALGESVAALLCSFLLFFWTYSHIIWLQAMVAWLPFMVAITLHEPPVHQKQIFEFKKIKALWRQILHDQKLVQLLALNFVAWMLGTFIAIWIIQKFWQEQGVPLAWFGLLWAASNFTIGLTGLFTRRLEKSLSVRHVLIVIAVLCVAAYFLMPVFGGILGILFGFFIYIARGLNNVVSRDLLNQTMEPALRATANSILNFLFRFTFAVIGPAIGFSIDRWGLNPTLFVIGCCFLLCGLFVTLPLLRLLKNTEV